MKIIVYILISIILLAVVAGFTPKAIQLGDEVSKTPISDKLDGKTDVERADTKSEEIVKYSHVTTFVDPVYGYTIEIQSIEKIDKGVQLFARAWDASNNPIGFGDDGTIEIERFRFFNPPILVPDGTKRQENSDGRIVELDNFKEDPVQAIQVTLAHTIHIVKKDGSAVVQGKIGNTTSTFNPTSTASCRVRFSGLIALGWNAIITGTAGDNLSCTESPQNVQAEKDATHFFAGRGFNAFDTSAIPDTDVVSAVTFSVVSANSANDADSTYFGLRIATPADPANIAVGDYDTFSGSALSANINIADITDGVYTDFAGNATFIAAVSLTGYTTVASMNGRDLDNSAPTGLNSVDYYQSARAGTSEDPKLVVVHAAAAAATPKYDTSSFFELF